MPSESESESERKVKSEEMPGESVAGNRSDDLPVNFQLPADVEVPHVDVDGVEVPGPVLLLRQLVERDRVSSHETTLHQTRVFLARLHQG